MTTTSAPTVTILDCGIWFDDVHGQLYNDQRVFDLARAHGMSVDEEDVAMVRRVTSERQVYYNEFDQYQWVIEHAVEYLNDHVAPEGAYFSWFEGCFYLMREGDDG